MLYDISIYLIIYIQTYIFIHIHTYCTYRYICTDGRGREIKEGREVCRAREKERKKYKERDGGIGEAMFT